MTDSVALWIDEVHRYNKRLHLASPGMLCRMEEEAQRCMDLLEDVHEGMMVDLGSGSGLPAIPYKIMHPDAYLYMMERSEKRCAFLRHVIDLLGLERIEVMEDDPVRQPARRFDAIMTRAFSPRAELEGILKGILNPGGRFYYMGTNVSQGFCAEFFTKTTHRSTRGLYLETFEFRPGELGPGEIRPR
ncbi:MAG: RsmG family class I SAM-dependent methyltransferase [Thermodesulfobacteriota bacterium]|nr:RsmG family class I SAM-dependent methyltransferase [Thermodesulfobacteriota bacterium]